MAVTITDSDFILATSDDQNRLYPIDNGGKIRILHAIVTQGAAAGDIGSQFRFFAPAFGRVRFLPYLARVKCSAFGASRTVSFGLSSYYSSSTPADVAAVAEDDTCLGAATDVSAAQLLGVVLASAPMKYDVYSRGPAPIVLGTLAGGTVPAAATIELLMPYVAE